MEQWSVIVITCSSSLASCIENEVESFQKRGVIPSSVPVLTVVDPANNIGSGAATVNGLLVAAEYLSVQKNFSVINADVLEKARVLIMHQGRDCIYSSCGKSLITVPKQWSAEYSNIQDDVCTNLEQLLNVVGQLSQKSPYGVWVCSTDMSLIATQQGTSVDWESTADVVLFSVASDVKYALHHGCVTTYNQGLVGNIVYCASSETIAENMIGDGLVPIVSGVVFMSSKVAESLLSLYSVAPLESCTYIGLDSGAEPFQLSFFFDILMSMAADISKDEFLAGKYGKLYNIQSGYECDKQQTMQTARSLIWKALSKFQMTSIVLQNFKHFYWANQDSVHEFLQNLSSVISWKCYHSFPALKDDSSISSPLVINTFLNIEKEFTVPPSTCIVDSEIVATDLQIGKHCYLYGIDSLHGNKTLWNIPDYTVLLGFKSPVSSESIFATFGIHDHLFLPYTSSKSTIGNEPWSKFFNRLNVSERDLWSEDSEKTLMNARIYAVGVWAIAFLMSPCLPSTDNLKRWKNSPKFSLSELLAGVDYNQRQIHKRRIYAKVTTAKMKRILLENKDQSLLSYFAVSVAEGWFNAIIQTLDSILLEKRHYAIVTRTLSAMADLFGIMAGKDGGLRTGPGSNRLWSTAFKFLMDGELEKGMMELRAIREEWLHKPRDIMRAARHYERAAQIIIQNCLKDTANFIHLGISSRPPMGLWVIAKCPARIDIQGGWTDTPPICYELGGSVVNIGVLIDDQKPIFAKARRKKEINIELIFGNPESPTRLTIQEKSQILDFDQPFARGALLKAAIVCSGIVDPNSDSSLYDQLQDNCDSGLEICSHSNLPQGCGMGTSSILAGAIIAVLWSVAGKKFDKLAIIHAVLHIEQLLTTGGGWQDQVGGVLGGINRAFCQASLPLLVEVKPIPVSELTLELLNSHLVLIYTGKVRLAKNILQNVIRNWYARDQEIVNCFKELLSSSLAMEKALLNGDLPSIGALMNRYWKQKKILAPGCEPLSIRRIMDIVEPFSYGQLLVGAGGGGFMCVLSKTPNSKDFIQFLLAQSQVSDDLTCHTASIHSEGLTITTEP